MKSKIMILGLMLVLLSAGYVMAEEKEFVNTEVSENADTEEKEDAVKFCPVCGPEEEMHGLVLGYKYKGKKYTFCSMECLKAFKKNPEQFLDEKISTDEDKHGKQER